MRNNIDFLRVLKQCNTKQRRALLQAADNKLLKAICECVLNVLRGTVKLSPAQKGKLRRHRETFRELANKRISLAKKKKAHCSKRGRFPRSFIITRIATAGKFASIMARKMLLVPENYLSNSQQRVQTNPLVRNLSELDLEMKSILSQQDMADDEN